MIDLSDLRRVSVDPGNHRAWCGWQALVRHAGGCGGYVNFMADYDEDRMQAACGPARYQRLARIKARYDPDTGFRMNANIRPAPGRTEPE